LWGTALFTLFPGNLIGAWIIEKLFWQSGLSLVSMGILSTLLLVVINAAVWFAVGKTLQIIYARFFVRSDVSKTPASPPTRS